MDAKNYTKTYKDNQMMSLELKNMYIIMEENKDLKEDLNRLKSISYDVKIKEMTQENADIRKRNGYLLITNDELTAKNKELSEQIERLQLSSPAIPQDRPTRPATASIFGRKKDDIFDSELADYAQS